MALRDPPMQPRYFTVEELRPREGNGLARGSDRVPIPKTAVERQRGGADCGRPRAALPTRLLFPDSVFFLFCLQIERTGPRCPCPTAVFMAA